MFKDKHAYLALILMAIFTSQTQAQAQDSLTLEQAYTVVLNSNPRIQSFKARVVAAKGHTQQEAMIPNPQITFEAENFGAITHVVVWVPQNTR